MKILHDTFPREVGSPKRKLIKNRNQFYNFVNLYNKHKTIYYSIYNCDDFHNFDNCTIDKIFFDFDGEQAYELYKTLIPDVIILDMNMPNYDGGYALEKITQDYPDAKIIVVTAFTDYTFEKAKAAAIITKPYDFEPFLDTIKKVVRGEITSPIIK